MNESKILKKEAELLELFPSEYSELIQRYKAALINIFEDYHVVIFMARKAICFYKALVINEIIGKPNCEVFSSRVLTYNIFQNLKGKRVIVVDDIVRTGSSIKNVLKTLYDNGIDADVYILSRQELKLNEEDKLHNINIVGAFAELTEEDTLKLSKNIADYIEASTCPYNIDQPIYRIPLYDDDKIISFIEDHYLTDTSSGQKQNHGIKSYTLEIPNKYFNVAILGNSIELCKIRFMYGKYGDRPVLLAIPFVLFGEMKNEELEIAFSSFDNKNINSFVFNSNDKIIRENQLKILHFVFANQLMEAFCNAYGVNDINRLDSNDDFVFSKNILKIINTIKNSFNFTCTNIINETEFTCEFKQDEYLSLTYDFLYTEDKMRYHNYKDSDNVKIETDLLVLANLKRYIEDNTKGVFDSLLFSNNIDILIDKGLIIPSIVHGYYNGNCSTIIRAYKCGEVYSLNEKHFKLFTYALCEYLKGIKHDRLQKTEFEKLCVLFFREAVKNVLKRSEKDSDEEQYSICYSKFGPRVSTSKPIYSADENSTLAAKLITLNYISDEDSYRILKEVTKEDIGNQDWELIAQTFSDRYEYLYENLFNEDGEEILFDEVRDMHMRTYIEFLIMLSIGLNKTDQLLSLLAEIYLVDSIEVTGNIKQTLKDYCRITDGLVSGMWKYMCYMQPIHPLNKVYSNLRANKDTKNISTYISQIFILNPDIDQNKYIFPMIGEVGRLIFSIVYYIWFMCEKYKIPFTMRGELVDLSKTKTREFYYRDLADLRKIIAEQVNSITPEQALQTLQHMKLDAKRLLERYNVEIAKGTKHQKKDEKKNSIQNKSNEEVLFIEKSFSDTVMKKSAKVLVAQPELEFEKINNGLWNPKINNQYNSFLEAIFLKANEDNVDVIVFPELSIPKSQHDKISKWTEDNDCIVVAGSDYFKDEEDGQFYSTASLFHSGKQYKTEKIHISSHEASVLVDEGASERTGHQYYFSNTPVGNLGIIICSDVFGEGEYRHGVTKNILNLNLDILCLIACQNGAKEHYQKINQLIKDAPKSPYVIYCNVLSDKISDGKSAFFANEHKTKREDQFINKWLVPDDDYSTHLIEMPSFPGCLVFKCKLPAGSAILGDRSSSPALAFDVHRPFVFDGKNLIELSEEELKQNR